MRIKRPTINDVAARAGVSVGTVSNVVNGTTAVSKRRRERVLKVIKELGYSQNMLARGLRRNRSPVVGLCVPHTSIAYFSALVDAFEEVASSNGIEIMQVLSRQDPQKEYQRVQSLLKYHVGGVILVPTMKSEATLDLLANSGVPVVVVDRLPPERFGFDGVTFDNHAAMRQATQGLIDRGHRNILFIVRERMLGVTIQRVEALQQTAKAWPESVVTKVLDCGENQATLTARLAAELQRRNRPTAIIVSNSTLAAWLIRALRVLKLRCSEDVSVLAFDEPEWADLVMPALSVVRQPTHEIARTAWAFLMQRMRNEAHDMQRIHLDAQVIFRESVRNITLAEATAGLA